MARTTTKPGARDAGLQRTFASSKSAATQRPKVNRSRQQDRAERAIASIRIGPRDRSVLGEDVDDLAASIEDVGLINAITVDETGLLLAGGRRLAACKQLGWKKIPVYVARCAR
jgi:hypothetical protein